MAKLYYLGSPSHVYWPMDSQLQVLLDATGFNTGNLLIGNAIKRQLGIEPAHKGELSDDPKQVEEIYDHVVLGAANYLFRNIDLTAYANFLEKVHLPCTIIGLGAQAPTFTERVEVPDGTKRLMKIISERCVSLGVRGHFTASVLEYLGIKNLRVIGCPSMYWTRSPEIKIKKKPFETDFKVALNGSVHGIAHASDPAAAFNVESKLAALAVKNDYPFILQNELYEMKILSGEDGACVDETVRSLKHAYGLNMRNEDFIKFIKTNMRVFFSVEEWMAYIRSFDFVMGTRFHGCLIALLNEVPSLIFVHDARTREMSELLRMPFLDVQEIRDLDLKRIYEQMDLDLLRNTYTVLYGNYIDFLEENGLEHCLEQPEQTRFQK